MSGRRTTPPRGSGARGVRPATPAPPALGDAEIAELQALLDAVPAPLDPLDVVTLDGFLCGVIDQPDRVPRERWLAFITDIEGRALPPGHDARRLHALVLRREAELRWTIERRAWFDPWVFELEPQSGDGVDDLGDLDAVYPWVAGFATALELFPELMSLPSETLNAPLALLYRYLDPDDLEDADELLAEIESLEPPADLAEAVEGLVRATLLLADAAGRAAQRRLSAR